MCLDVERLIESDCGGSTVNGPGTTVSSLSRLSVKTGCVYSLSVFGLRCQTINVFFIFFSHPINHTVAVD